MSDRSNIEWTDATWNPTTGCTVVSAGCDHCYAKTMHERFNGPGSFDRVTLHPDRLDKPLRWRKPKRVFVNSMSDLFHEAIPDDYIAQVFAIMALAPQHTFQVLTKRHGRMRSLLARPEFEETVARAATQVIEAERSRVLEERLDAAGWIVDVLHSDGDLWELPRWPLPNVWLGVSVENQQWADIRIPALLDTPAAVRFLSCEPLLGPVDLAHWIAHTKECKTTDEPPWCICPPEHRPADPYFYKDKIDWVIVGGESGRGARPMHPDWARSLRDQCQATGVAYLFKQWGEWKPDGYGVRAGVNPGCSFYSHDARPAETWLPGPAPDDPRLTHTILRRVGKGKAGRELDGRTWDEFPQAVDA